MELHMEKGSDQEHKNVLLIYNPVAGQDDAGASRRKIEERFKTKGWDLDIYETTGEEILADIVRERAEKDVDLVIAVGGDGTVVWSCFWPYQYKNTPRYHCWWQW
jgi:predicted polyphosphate/ATP-dependent NAD kinase